MELCIPEVNIWSLDNTGKFQLKYPAKINKDEDIGTKIIWNNVS